MMVNGQSSAIFLTCIQCYGGDAGGAGGLSIWPEYNAKVGHPVAEPLLDTKSSLLRCIDHCFYRYHYCCSELCVYLMNTHSHYCYSILLLKVYGLACILVDWQQ